MSIGRQSSAVKEDKITAYARENEDDFVRMVMKKSHEEMNRSLRDDRRELEQAQNRIRRPDEIIRRLYEDNIEGKISDERFARMSTIYEEDQRSLESRVTELKAAIASGREQSDNADSFLSIVRNYTDIKELTPGDYP